MSRWPFALIAGWVALAVAVAILVGPWLNRNGKRYPTRPVDQKNP